MFEKNLLENLNLGRLVAWQVCLRDEDWVSLPVGRFLSPIKELFDFDVFQIVFCNPIAASLSLDLVNRIPLADSLENRRIDLVPMVFVLAHECFGSRVVDFQLFCTLNHRVITSLISL